MPKITTFLAYNDRAEEAAEFYVSIFRNSRIKSVSRFGDGGPGAKGKAMSVQFELDGQDFVAINGGPHFTFTDGISLAISCRTQDETDTYWQKLTDGGEPGRCGWLKDKFGLSWQVTPAALGELLGGPEPAKSKRAVEAMLKMNKFDIAALKKAYDGE